MMGHGYRPDAVRRVAQAADLPDLDLRLPQRRRRQAPFRGRDGQASGRGRRPGLFALQRAEPGNPRGPARHLGKCRGRAGVLVGHVGDRHPVPRDGQAGRHDRPFGPALCRDRNADRAHPRQVRGQLARFPGGRDARGNRRGHDARARTAATSRSSISKARPTRPTLWSMSRRSPPAATRSSPIARTSRRSRSTTPSSARSGRSRSSMAPTSSSTA